MKKIITLVLVATITTTLFGGCNNNKATISKSVVNTKVENLDFKFKVEPETFKVTVEANGDAETVSEPLEKMEVSNLKDSGDKISWSYSKQNIDVEIQKKDKYLDVSIKSTNKGNSENKFSWPKVAGEGYILPLHEGKYIPKDDKFWKEYLNDNEIKTLEGFSMQFFAASKKDYSVVYTIKNPYNNEVKFHTQENINFTFNHEYPSINKNKEYGFRVYLTKNNPVDIAKTYKNVLIEEKKFKSLEEKAKDNKNIEKLYGAPHVYFWDRSVISAENVKWNKLKGSISKDLKLWMQELLKTKVEDGTELATAFNDLDSLADIDKYIKNMILKGISSVVQLKEFYNPKVFVNLDSKNKELVDKGIDKLNPVEVINLNKGLLKSSLGEVVDPIEKWGDANTIDVVEDMKKSGIDKMWIGLDDYEEGFVNPEFVEKANELGYLIGTYDSYHSIHKPGEEKWITAKFTDTSLYENATVTNKAGKKIEGFQGVGRKLNPTLAMASVKDRVSSILNTGLKFNSWFLDTDATGEVFDDYSNDHTTTEEEDINARIWRMDYLQKKLNMVVGSEGGNDFASKSIAFAHGIETPAFSWMDKDMSKNKESEYYVGKYYSSTGGVPEMFSKQIPIKEKYKKLFMDSTYNIPLYKLVYNDSVITSHWWGWGTLKIKDEVENRMMYEILYNVPPMYHIDKNEWGKNKEVIIKHTKAWSDFSKKAINKEMTDFKILSDDRLVQMSKYGDDLKVIANFSNKEVNVEGESIAPKSLIIIDGNNKIKYTP